MRWNCVGYSVHLKAPSCRNSSDCTGMVCTVVWEQRENWESSRLTISRKASMRKTLSKESSTKYFEEVILRTSANLPQIVFERKATSTRRSMRYLFGVPWKASNHTVYVLWGCPEVDQSDFPSGFAPEWYLAISMKKCSKKVTNFNLCDLVLHMYLCAALIKIKLSCLQNQQYVYGKYHLPLPVTGTPQHASGVTLNSGIDSMIMVIWCADAR